MVAGEALPTHTLGSSLQDLSAEPAVPPDPSQLPLLHLFSCWGPWAAAPTSFWTRATGVAGNK